MTEGNNYSFQKKEMLTQTTKNDVYTNEKYIQLNVYAYELDPLYRRLYGTSAKLKI